MQNESLRDLIRYEEQLKAKLQETDNQILDQRQDKAHLAHIDQLINEEEVLMKYLQVEMSNLSQQLRNIYSRNVTRFKKKIREHREYVQAYFGKDAVQSISSKARISAYQSQNAELAQKKQTMYGNLAIQNNVGVQLDRQGNVLSRQFDGNREVQQDIDEAESNIDLIHKAIMKRKIMFFSLILFFCCTVVFVVVKKIRKLSN